jgi:hypothetical protein
VDPSVILTRETVQRLMKWLGEGMGRVLALPKTALYSNAARASIEASSTAKRIEINLGVLYRLQPVGEGKLVIYDASSRVSTTHHKFDAAWDTFLGAMLSLADIQEPCRATDARLSLIPLERRDASVGLFILNGAQQIVSGDILFQTSVSISDLASEVAKPREPEVRQGLAPASRRFSLDVPAFGILPLAVDRVGLASQLDNAAADQLGNLSAPNAQTAALTELPGFDSGGPNVWN